ncbi:unnamed protein product [marine sediment metagenome]|uniref:Uncharacterized protein n=1 Tax=marine sediment metagenome TaxID=412755 RepID=X1IRB2_9ZZZZ
MALKKEKRESEKTPFENPLTKLTKFLTVPQNVPSDQAEVVDSQGDLSHPDVAVMLMYHRTLSDRFAILDGRATKGDVITRFANRVSLLTWANNRKSREEAVELGKHLRSEEHEPIETEHLDKIPLVPVEAEKKKKRLGLI